MVEGSYTLEVRGWEEYSANLDRVKDAFSQAMDDIANDVVRRIQEEAPSDTGQLMSNEMWVVEKTDDFTRTIRSAKEYALYVQEGTGPAHEPDPHEQYFPPPDALEVWASRHGIDNPYLLARHIYRYGTQPNPYATRAIESSQGAGYTKYMEDALARAGVTT